MQELWGWQGPAAVIALTLLFALGLVVLALWIALPFAVFGTKAVLRDLLEAQRETNRKLDQIRKTLEDLEQKARERGVRDLRDGLF
jgi:predicted PurR-regulated permease PerM